MISTHQVTESSPPRELPPADPETPQQPYATIWMNGMEVLLFEDEDGEFFTA